MISVFVTCRLQDQLVDPAFVALLGELELKRDLNVVYGQVALSFQLLVSHLVIYIDYVSILNYFSKFTV